MVIRYVQNNACSLAHFAFYAYLLECICFLQYYDDFRNPFKIRGVPQSETDLDVEKTTLGRYPQKPFLLSVAGNKNPVLDNDRFDVMCTESQPMPKRPGHTTQSSM